MMATRGHDTLGDSWLGSHTELVLEYIRCPLLAVPLRTDPVSEIPSTPPVAITQEA